MNSPNPLLPQGSLQSSQQKGRSNVRIAVVTIIAIHVVFFGGLLMQGCKRDTPTAGASQTNTNLSLPPIDTGTGYFNSATNLPEVAHTPATNEPIPTPPVTNETPAPAIPAPAVGPVPGVEAKEYTVLRGDSFYKIAKQHGVSVSNISRANPNIDPARLRPGQKLIIPPAAPVEAKRANGNGRVHVVKGGETLTAIAKKYGTSIRELRSFNGLRTDRLLVGQELKIPTGATNMAPEGGAADRGNGAAPPS